MRRTVVILGGTGGMGIATVRRFFEEETCDIYTISANQQEINSAREEFKDPNGTFTAYLGSVTDTAHIRKIYKEIGDKHGKFDVLVNAVGTLISGTIDTMDEASFRKMLEVNLFGVFIGLKEALPYLKAAKDSYVVNISSLSSFVGGSSIGYSVAKAGVDMLSKDAARDLGCYNIHVNTVNPGLVTTGFQIHNKTMDPETYKKMCEKVAEGYPLGIGCAEDIAGAIYFLSNPRDARWLTGVNLIIDGGKIVNSNNLSKKD